MILGRAMTEIAPYGTWKSPISAADVARGGTAVSYPSIAGDEVWWQESRPAEGGRVTIMASASADSTPRELLPAPWYARNRVHEYGGKSYLPVPSLSLAGGFDLVFANFADQRLYAVGAAAADGGEPVPLTPADGGFRFADLVLPPDGREIWCVRETVRPDDGQPEAGFHTGGGMKVRREIVAVPTDGAAADDEAAIRVLVSGAQFFAFPTPSPDGTKLAWINWNHPQMPWDGTELRVGPASGVTVREAPLVMGGPSESVLAPVWRDDATLYVISDASGWWNVYEVAAAAGSAPRPLHPGEEEFAGPLWQLGGRPYALLGDGRLAVLHGRGGMGLGLLDPETGELADVSTGYPVFASGLSADGMSILGIAGGPTTPLSVIRVDATTGKVEVLGQEAQAPDAAYLPVPRQVLLEGRFGRTVHALVYPPANPDVSAPEGELPPYVVWVHGGPTSHVVPLLDIEKAYFTSRGIGIVDVNYGGSTGYGRRYRERLRRQWGVVDVEDAIAAAQALADAGEADGARLAIRGGSAGGWTALAAVTTHAGSGPVFSAAASYYGVADLRGFAAQTHDFESRYLDSLVGPLPGFEAIYAERSPAGHVTEATCPVLLLQGLDDPVVPPAQSEAIATQLAEHGIRHAYLSFKGESHGFRRADTIINCLEAELSFYGQILGFQPPGIPALTIVTGRTR